tara:strand:+ start:664 stop:951 length:288 start_codon:yes stop_codon:yes gene_type:complete
MSIQVRTASMLINPIVNESANGRTYYSTDVMEPVNYNVEFSNGGGNNPKHLEQAFRQAHENGEPIDITFSQKNGRFGTTFVIYDIKAQKPAINKA